MKKLFTTIEKYSIWLILSAAALVRFTGLTKRDFWYDEAFTGIAVKESWGGMLAMITNDVHPPLYYAMLKLFAMPFEYGVFGIRLLSAIFGILAVWALYLFTKELFSRRAAIFAAILATISPIAIQYSQEARMYSMLVTLILFAAYFLIRALKTGSKKYYFYWGIFVGLSALTHYMGIIFAPLYYFAYLVWHVWEYEGLKKKVSWKSSGALVKRILPDKNFLTGVGVAFILFLPWIGKFFLHIGPRRNNLDWIKPVSMGDIVTNIQMFLFGTPLGEMSAGMPQPNEFVGIEHMTARILLAVAVTLMVINLYKRENKKALLVTCVFSFGFLLLIYTLSLLGKQYFVVRYVLAAGYFLFALIGVWLAALRWRWIFASFALYAILLASMIPLGYSRGYNEMIKHLDRYQGKNFYILNSFDYVICKYYLGADNLTLYNVDWPQYNPDYWAAVGKDLKRTENYEQLRNDPESLIISNQQLTRDNQYFSTKGLELVDKYENVLIYRFDK